MRWLLAFLTVAAFAQQKPLLVSLGEAPPLAQAAAGAGWLLTSLAPNGSLKDVQQAVANPAADPKRIYLCGQGGNAAVVLFVISRLPDPWAAALAIGGEPKSALDTNRVFAANAKQVPLLWVAPIWDQETAYKIQSALPDLRVRTDERFSVKDAMEWLASHQLDELPNQVDCESGTLEYARCRWVQILKFDPAQRNDALPSTRIPPGAGASLALGGFGFKTSDPGPGVLVSWLPENYSGPLKMGDRIVAVGGQEIQDAKHYVQYMDHVGDEKPVAAMVQRGKERMRVETRFVLPNRGELTTGRVQAEFTPDPRELTVVTRGVGALRLYLPAHWAPAPIMWNGTDAGTADQAGCWQLDPSGKAARCGGGL